MAEWNEFSQQIIATLNLKKTAKGEWHGACPNCGGKDRFWISQHNGEVRAHCRQCDDFKAIRDNLRDQGLLPKFERSLGALPVGPDLADFQDTRPYHERKGVGLHNAALDGDVVVVPMHNLVGEIVGHQRITPNGNKRFTKGMAKEGAFSVLGGRLEGQVYIAEGWATAASVTEATGRPCVFALDAGNLPKVVATIAEARPDVQLIVAADNDSKGGKAAAAANVPYALPPAGMDWNDVMVRDGREAVTEGLARVIDAGVTPKEEAARLTSAPENGVNFAADSKGHVPFNHHNALEILTKYDEWREVFAFDEFSQKKVVTKPLPGRPGNPNLFKPRELRDSDYTDVLAWFNMNGFLRAPKNTVVDAVDRACLENIISPVRHYLESVERMANEDPEDSDYLDDWAIRMLGVEPTDDQHRLYVYEVSRKWLISAVARALEPGSKADSVLILEGSQGAGKSTALKILAGEAWFGDALPHMGSKDASDYLRGKWIIELAELSNINKAEVEVVKSFVSRTEERFRPAYGRNEIAYKRACVFAGSTNKSEYLRDETGNRRFWPLKCGRINHELLLKERDRLWGEAVRAYRSGEAWWLSGDAEEYARDEQSRRQSVDLWVDAIRGWADGKQHVCISEAALGALGLPISSIRKPEQNRIVDAFRMLGYERNGIVSSGDFKGSARYSKEVRAADPAPW